VFETTVSSVVDPAGASPHLLLASRAVTDQEEALAEASRFEARFEAMLAYSSDGFVLADAEGRITYASVGCEELLGISPAELVALGTVADRVHPDDVAMVTAHWVSALEHPGSVQAFEVRMRHEDGAWRDLAVRTVNRLDAPDVDAVVTTFRDTTQRVAAQREAAREHGRLKEILAGASDAILTVDATQTVVTFNEAAEEMFGYRADEIVGQPLGMLVPERFRDMHAHHVEAFGGGEVKRRLMSDRAELSGRRKDGAEFPAEITISRIRLDGEVCFTAIVRDVTERRAAAAALHASEARLWELVAHSSEMIVIVGREGRVLWASPATQPLLGYPPEIPGGKGFSIFEIAHPEDHETLRARFAEAQRQPGVPLEFEGRGLHADGSWPWLAATITDLCDNPAVGGIVFNVHDVTRLRGLAAQEAVLAQLGHRALSGLAVADLAAETVTAIAETLDVDLAFHAQISADGDDLLTRAFAGRVDGPSDALPVGAHTHWGKVLAGTAAVAMRATGEGPAGTEALLAVGIVSGVTVGIAAGDQPFGVLGAYATTARRFSADETDFLQGAANVLASAIDRRQFERDLEHQMLHDGLTELPNRMLLDDRLGQALARRDRRDGLVAVLLIDLDDFKVVNDTLGHTAGDTLLQAVATRIGSAIRPADTLARFGGDEFVVVAETDTRVPESATEIAERILAALRPRFQVTPDHELFATASIGIAVADTDMHPAMLISEADLAMYQAKRAGGDTSVVFDEAMRSRVEARLDLALALRYALELDELRLAYQPKIDLATGRIVDVEALLRWERPHEGLLTPDTFLETAEHTGVIVPIGDWVITQACAQAADWQHTFGARAPQRVFVNLSPRQLLHPDLIPTVERALDATALDPVHLGFEVTEHVFIDDFDAAADILRRLHDHGIHLCLDDFGTGYSSLTYLRRLPFDCLKIDKSFVDGLSDDRDDDKDTTAIITAIIDMAHDLGLVVTAEGVESPSQVETLTFLRCDRAQGHHYSRAVPPDELDHLLADNDPDE
jgi:diguanylate cyclase (GGDEF)-like protein/PAS domain S-box-containing protein